MHIEEKSWKITVIPNEASIDFLWRRLHLTQSKVRNREENFVFILSSIYCRFSNIEFLAYVTVLFEILSSGSCFKEFSVETHLYETFYYILASWLFKINSRQNFYRGELSHYCSLTEFINTYFEVHWKVI